jgi:hypothetical protein
MTKTLRRVEATEHQIQCAIVDWCSKNRSGIVAFGLARSTEWISDFLVKIPNEGKRSWFIGKVMKKEGLKKGVSDLFLALPRREKCGLWIEVKSKYGKLTNEQSTWLELMYKLNYGIAVINSVDEGIQAIKDYLGMR